MAAGNDHNPKFPAVVPPPATPPARPKLLAKKGEPLAPEAFISRHFLKMPAPVRVLVYLLVVFVYLYNTLHEPTLVGQLWVRTPQGKSAEAANYRIQTSYPSDFVTNAEGRWALPASTRLPFGSVRVELVDNEKKELLADAMLCRPIPVLGPLLNGEQKYRLTYDPMAGTLKVGTTSTCASLEFLSLAVWASSGQQQIKNPRYVTVKEMRLMGTGHRDTPAEIYFRVFVNDHETMPLGFPARALKNSWLLVRDDDPVILRNLTFTVERGSRIRLEVWDRDTSIVSSFKNQDDQLASFFTTANAGIPETRVLTDSRGSTVTVALH
jgi:hypothetical protein